MATYEYICKNDHVYTETRPMTEPDKADRVCEICDNPLRRIYGTPAITFRGTGFYAKRG